MIWRKRAEFVLFLLPRKGHMLKAFHFSDYVSKLVYCENFEKSEKTKNIEYCLFSLLKENHCFNFDIYIFIHQ